MKPEELGAWQALLQEEFEKPYWQLSLIHI